MPYPDQDLFGTKEEALEKAKVIGCYLDENSYHEQAFEGETFFMPCKTHTEYDEALGQRAETREHIDVPQYIQDNAKRGLEYYEQGFGGDGLVQATIDEARDMAEGKVSHEKAKKMKNWFSRHITDLDSDDAEAFLSGESSRPSRGQCAWLLWGGSINKENQMDAQKWAERYVATLEEEDTGERMSEITRDKVFTSAPKQVRPTPEHDIRYVTNEMEYRTLEGSKAVISGYASVFNKKSQVLGGGFVEVINNGAFNKTLQERGTQTSRDDIKALFNHDTSLVLGSKRAGTLKLSEDKAGLHCEVNLDLDIPHHRSAFLMIERGDVTNSSFGFDVLDERWNVSDDAEEPVVREVLETRLYEVSPTAFPAYQDSTVMAERSFRNLAHMSGLHLDKLIEANENGELKSLLQKEEETVFNADARKRRLELLKNQ